jgi:hypothetical protein
VGSILLGEENTTDKDEEIKDAENSEDNNNLDNAAKLYILMKEVENL